MSSNQEERKVSEKVGKKPSFGYRLGRLGWGLALCILSLGGIAVVLAFLYTQVYDWLFRLGFIGNDTSQFIHYFYYYLKNPHFPVNAWDYFWHNGVPRTIDLAWMHFTLGGLLSKAVGVYQAVKLYPVITFGLGAVFVYLLFYELSRSVLISTALSVSFVMSHGYYEALFSAGVGLSACSQMFLPAQLYFLARFARRGGSRNLLLGALMSVFGLAGHGLLMMFFGFLPSCVFLFFLNRENKRLVTRKSFQNTLLFALVVFAVGAYILWPSIHLAIIGGSANTFYGGVYSHPDTLRLMFEYTNQGIAYGFVGAVVLSFFLLLFRVRPNSAFRPVLILVVADILWMISYTYTGNPVFGVLFPGRIFWIWPLGLGALTAVMSAPLSEYPAKKWFVSIGKFVGFGVLKLGLVGLILFPVAMKFGVLNLDDARRVARQEFIIPKEWETQDIPVELEKRHGQMMAVIGDKIHNKNLRFWSHDQSLNLSWIPLSNMPMSEGYAHIFHYWSRLWEGWFYGTMSGPNWESQEIPREMARQQSLFLLDWYGVKYMAASRGGGEWEVAEHFYEPQPYVDRSIVFDDGRSFFVLNDEYTSPIVAPVDVPVIGYVGSGEGYMSFLKDIATLNLNTRYLIPVRLTDSVADIASSDLDFLDAVVVYDYRKGGFGYGAGWRKLADFARSGGAVWIENGGNSGERESGSPPELFPMFRTEYGPLGVSWDVAGELAQAISFAELSPLQFREAPWQVSYVPDGMVKPESEVLLTQQGKPIVVEQTHGHGKVIWTGANFWYRPEEFRTNGMKEAEVIRWLLVRLLGGIEPTRVSAQVDWLANEHVRVQGSGFTGIAFKVTDWPGWTARVISGGREQKVPLFKAGPELYYAPIPREVQSGPMEVWFDYRGWWFYWFLFFISVSSGFVYLYFLITKKPFFKTNKTGARMKFGQALKQRVSGWWGKEEE